MLSNYILVKVCDSNRLPIGHYDRKEGFVILSARAADRAADEAGVYRKFGGCPSPFRSGSQAFLQNGVVNAPDKRKATDE